MISRKLSQTLVFIISGLIAAQAMAFPFWLEAPPSTRPNAFDRQSPLFVATVAPIVVVGTPTWTLTVTSTRTVTPTFTNSPPVTLTNSPTITPTPTITLTNTPGSAASPTPSPTVAVVMYDDMENPMCGGYGGYEDGTTSGFGDPVAETGTVFSGLGSWYQSFTTGTSWGCGWGFSAMGSCTVIDARPISPTHVYLWIKTDGDLSIYFTFVEDTASISGAVNSEHWTSLPVAVTASPSWQLIEAKLSDFIPNDYFHTTLGNPMDDSVFQYVVNEADIQYGAGSGALVNIYMDDYGFADRGQLPAAPIKVDDFEGSLCYDGTYCDDGDCANGAGTDIAQSYVGVPHNGAQSLLLQATVDSVLDTSGYGGGFYWGYPVGCGGEISMAIATKFEFWVKTDYAVNMSFILREGVGVDPNRPGVAGEYWQNPNINIPVAGGAWQLISIPLSNFTIETAASIALAPAGDDIFNISKVFDIQIQFATDTVGPRTLANVYIDDMYFVP